MSLSLTVLAYFATLKCLYLYLTLGYPAATQHFPLVATVATVACNYLLLSFAAIFCHLSADEYYQDLAVWWSIAFESAKSPATLSFYQH